MSSEEIELFDEIYKFLQKKKKTNSLFYNCNETKYLYKNEFYITNSVKKKE